MSEQASSLRLDGLEADNLLAFLALLGLLRALEAGDRECAADERLRPRAAWDVDDPPLRPRLHLARAMDREEVTEKAACGIDLLAAVHDFDGRKDLKYTRDESRELLCETARHARLDERGYADLLAALMSDAALRKDESVEPTPLCLLSGQGHQHFLERLATVPRQSAPPGGKRKGPAVTAADCLSAALFEPWTRNDPTFSFRWDPEEDVRYALMAGDPTDAAYKTGTQHGANRLASIGLAALTVVPEQQGTRVRCRVIGGAFADGFTFAWPIWRDPTSLEAIRALLAHPDLRNPAALAHLSVTEVMEAPRISVGKFRNFPRARTLRPERTQPRNRRHARSW